MASQIMAGSRALQLDFSSVHSVAVPTKDAVSLVLDLQMRAPRTTLLYFMTSVLKFCTTLTVNRALPLLHLTVLLFAGAVLQNNTD